jgi:predicted signal transduction protein with EAL and GGDEF domain
MPKGEDQAERLARLAREAHERAAAHDLAADGGEASDAHHHPAEAATDAEARERELRAHLRLLEEEERLLRLAEAAQRGEYGICADCGQEIPAARLEIEVTESTFIGDGEAARSMLLGLRRLGITVALDDFGTGFSSLAYLQALPIDVLKVDRSFVQGLEGGGASARIVDTVVRLAHGLGVRVVAEGVESQAQLEALRKLGCDTAQGYLLARPQPPQAITSLLLGIRATKTLAIPA